MATLPEVPLKLQLPDKNHSRSPTCIIFILVFSYQTAVHHYSCACSFSLIKDVHSKLPIMCLNFEYAIQRSSSFIRKRSLVYCSKFQNIDNLIKSARLPNANITTACSPRIYVAACSHHSAFCAKSQHYRDASVELCNVARPLMLSKYERLIFSLHFCIDVHS